jgi:spore germination protein
MRAPMTIHVVQPGETLAYISDLYNIPVERLILENGINNPDNLVIGQTIVIVQPEVVYTVQAGDTLGSIAQQQGVSLMELLRNNPYLSDRQFIYPGETLVIRYQTNKIRTIATSGYIFPYIDRSILVKTLPFLTYLTIFNYRVTLEGSIIASEDDTELIRLAKLYGVAPMMFVSTFTEQGVSSSEVVYSILSNPEVQDRLIDNTLAILESKGYYGVNMYAEYINYENIDYIADYLKRAADIFRARGYRIALTVTPEIKIEGQTITIERLDYSKLAVSVDAIAFSSYEWGRSYSLFSSVTPVNATREILNYAVSIIPPEKIFLGLITAGYDWQLPYVPGVSGANAVTYDSAIQIASEYGIPIQFNEAAQAPYFYYVNGEQDLHVVWFKDARSFNAIAGLVSEYGLQGLSIWTVMNFNAQLWFVINTQYDIEKVSDIVV